MGNITSIGEVPASIIVSLHQNVVYPGNVISGNVYLDVVKQSGVDCSALLFRVQGGEFTTARYTTTTSTGSGKNRRTHVHHHTVHGKSIFLEINYCLKDITLQKNLPFGQYEFPFSFVVPFGCPGSLYARYINNIFLFLLHINMHLLNIHS